MAICHWRCGSAAHVTALPQLNVHSCMRRRVLDQAKLSDTLLLRLQHVSQMTCRSINISCNASQGSIPDMTATTTAYLQLQRVYRERADADVAAVEAHAGRILTALGRSPTAIPHAVVRTYCKNARNLRCTPAGTHTATKI